jgi:hypothetical protein
MVDSGVELGVATANLEQKVRIDVATLALVGLTSLCRSRGITEIRARTLEDGGDDKFAARIALENAGFEIVGSEADIEPRFPDPSYFYGDHCVGTLDIWEASVNVPEITQVERWNQKPTPIGSVPGGSEFGEDYWENGYITVSAGLVDQD